MMNAYYVPITELQLDIPILPMNIYFFNNYHFPKVKLGENFTAEASFQHNKGVAFSGEGAYFASGLNEGGTLHFSPVPNNSFTGLRDWVTKSFGDSQPIESKYVPGTIYRRMLRPLVCLGNLQPTISEDKLNASFVALRILLSKLQDLFETVEPNETNLLAHGHKVRELLLLACMEIESSWTAVLKENNYGTTQRFTTNDYVKLAIPMFLDAYEVQLQSYSSFPKFAPFNGWNKINPTSSLPWYDAYNKTKHDREGNLKFANLENAVMAVGAAVVMFHAQFGFNFGYGGLNQKTTLIRNIFRISTPALSKYEKEFYIPKVSLSGEPRPAPTPSSDWVLMDYPF